MIRLLDRLRPSPTPQWLEPDSPPGDAPLTDIHESGLLARVLWHRGIRDGAAARAFLTSGPAAAPSPWGL
ncbi:MAG TPA: hypothetical protein VGR22_09920, partial [Thermomicrobiales bacterium]|nr:hypothetical protein [Thermomicrobiales bacterium]